MVFRPMLLAPHMVTDMKTETTRRNPPSAAAARETADRALALRGVARLLGRRAAREAHVAFINSKDSDHGTQE